jgi:hypothetical protein
MAALIGAAGRLVFLFGEGRASHVLVEEFSW